MRIKKLKLHGFKSFPDKTEIDLDASITALVGPNGCGKSNVVDAIKWVLGSQSPTSLRGDEMSDVIFKGSSSRNAIGFAKAEFVLDNEDGEIPLDYAEVSIGRKLYRSGESQYLINDEEVRLKDINELLYDTGIGVENYSLIEQGRIDRVLSSSPKERRELIEEAAGISTFQARKRESQRKLDRVQDDLDRVQDVLNELKKDIHSLKTQAGKAKKYKEHKRKLEEKRLLLHIDQYRDLVEKEERLHEEWQKTKKKRKEVEGRMKSTRNNEEELTRNLKQLQDKISSLKSEKNKLEKKLVGVNNSIDNLEDRLQTTRDEYNRLSKEDLEDYAERVEELEDEIEETERKRSKKQDELNTIERRKDELDEEAEQLRSTLSKHREEKSTLQQKQSDLREKREKVKRERREIQQRRERIKQEIDECSEKKKKIADKLSTFREDVKNVRNEIEEKEQYIEKHQGSLAILRRTQLKKHNEYRTVHGTLEQEREKHQQLTSRIQFLETLEEKQAGLSNATSTVLNTHDPEEDQNGVLGLLGNKIEFTDLGHRTIQGLLDPFLQFVVVEDWPTAEQVIETATDSDGHVGVLVKSALIRSCAPARYCRKMDATAVNEASFHRSKNFSTGNGHGSEQDSARSGRSTSSLKSSPGPKVPIVFNGHRDNGLSSLKQYLRTNPPYRQFIAQLLGSCGFDGPISAVETPGNLYPPRTSVASLENVVSSKHGLVFSRGETSVEENVMDRRRTLEQLQERQSTLSDQMETHQRKERSLSSGLDALEQEIQSMVAEIYETRVDLEHRRERVTWLTNQIDEQKRKKDEIEQNVSDLKNEDDGLKERLEEIDTSMEQIEQKQSSLDESIEDVQAEIQTVESSLEDVRENKQQLNVQKAQLNEKIQNLDEMIQRHKNDRKQARERIKSVRNRMSELEERREELTEELEKKRSEKASREDEREKLNEDIASMRDREQSIKQRQKEKEEKRKEIVETYNEIEKRSQDLEVKLKEAESNRKNLEERAREQLDRDFEEAVEEYDTPDEDVDRDELKDEVIELEKTLNRMGNVNLGALDLLEEKQERVEEIEEQEEDLKKSRQRLQRIIRKMKKESHKRFKETFEQGKENFNDLFRKLFGGGKATLKAVFDEDDEDDQDQDAKNNGRTNGKAGSKDLLECGIEIHAQPPGKDMTNLSLLSGGERAMTSIALMMALFMLNPSAICILDEADAPLDESNLDLFIGLLNEFTDLTQFLVITHKKKTITAADRVYGLTMQEDGVSQLISMDMEKRIPEEYLQENPEEQPGSVAGTLAE